MGGNVLDLIYRPVNAKNVAKNMHAKATMEKLKNEREQGLNDKTNEQIFQEVVGKDRHGCYGTQEKCSEIVMEAKKDVEEARKEVEQTKLEAKEARKEVETTRQEVDAKIEANNKLWGKKMKNMLEEFLRSSSHEVNVPRELLWLKEYVATDTLMARSRFAMRLPMAHKSTSTRAFLWMQFFL
ncbi:hypothetical protein Cgig2_018591 [Carnegiea gigantea]|uniref:Uncharacterized protein n=1 Tax=Carnegiea gigantea TaxID=171969 RepID=A0A9Q1K4W4_9CARY|nr:hypothetical protein Cgig2_018591 [Carnegiea gigantea]